MWRYLFVLCPLMIGCLSPKPYAELTTEDLQIDMTRGGCFGECPIYTISIYKGGRAVLEAKRFTSMEQGKYTKVLNKKQYRQIISAFEEANLYKYPDEYESLIPDLPLYTINWYGSKGKKTVRGRDNRPEEILNLQAMIEALYEDEDWELAEQKMNLVKQEDRVMMEEGSTAENIIIKLKEDADSAYFFKDMEPHGIQVIKEISKPLRLWLVTYDNNATTGSRVLSTIKRHEMVEEAQFDKKVITRER